MLVKVPKQIVQWLLSPKFRIPVIAILSAVVALAIMQLSWMKESQERWLDWAFRLRHQYSPATKQYPNGISPNIVLVGITDQDLQKFGPWPWTRELQAKLLHGIAASGLQPAAVGYDVLFPNPDSKKDGLKGDQAFAQALTDLGNICLAGNMHVTSSTSTKSKNENTEADKAWMATFALGADTSPPFKPDRETGLPHEAFRKGSHLGLINALRDEDGVHRQAPLAIRQGDHYLPSLSLQMAMLSLGVPVTGVTVVPNEEIRLKSADGELRIPVHTFGPYEALRINYRGSLRSSSDFVSVSFSEALNCVDGNESGTPVEAAMKSADGGLLVIGATATGSDVGATPMDRGTALVDMHLNALNTILTGDFLHEAPTWQILLLTVLLSATASWTTQRFAALPSFAVVAALLAVIAGICWVLFTSSNIWIPMAMPLLGLICSYTIGANVHFFGEERQKRQLRRTMQNYLSANIMEEVLLHPEAMEMGGKRKELTVLFTDVRGFTAFCEANPAEKVVPLLNELLECASEVIIKHDGTLDKYIGDAIMAFWGAPLAGKEHHARAAARAALGMREALRQLREDMDRRGLPALSFGIGINTGEMLVGNVGSQRFLRNYTVIGDEVNIAARLEGETRKFDTDIVISQATANHLGSDFKTHFLADVIVKGKKEPVKIYSLDSYHGK